MLTPRVASWTRSARAPTRPPRQGHDRPADQGKQIKVYVYNSQNATPDVQARSTRRRPPGIPVATVTETLTPAGDSFQDWQVSELQGLEARWPGDRQRSTMIRGEHGARDVRCPSPARDPWGTGAAGRGRWRVRGAPREWPADALVGVDLTIGRGRIRRGSRPQRRRQVHPGQGGARALPPPPARCARARRRPGAGRTRGSATCRSGAASTPACASAASTSSASGLDGDRWGLPLPLPARRAPAGGARHGSSEVIELVGAAAYAHRPIGAVLRRRAAAAADRAGAGPPARGCCCSTSRWTPSTCRTRPRSPR